MNPIGMYFRVEREGRFLTLDVTEMTRDEIGKILDDKDVQWKDQLIWLLVGMVIGLSSRLNDEEKRR